MKERIVIAIFVIGSALSSQSVYSLQGANPRGETALGGGQVAVEYGRPSTRGRDMLSLMPTGGYWRLGADTNTMLETKTPLRFGDTTIPAGSYPLLAHLADVDSWQLVVCRSVTENFSPRETLATVPLRLEEGRPHVEQLTLNLEGDGETSILVITWGAYRLSAEFSTAD